MLTTQSDNLKHAPVVVCGFEAFSSGQYIIGEVKEKEQAHSEYREAISKGHGAYLMDEEAPLSGRTMSQ